MYFEILKRLAEHGDFGEREITDIFAKVVHIPWVSRDKQIANFLKEMGDDGYITYSINNEVITASITLLGFDYFRDYELREKTLSSLKSQFIYNVITWAIAIAAIGLSIYTIDQNTDLSQRVRLLEQEKQQLKSQQHSQVATHKIPDTQR